jgi:hypothetical protein
VRRNYLALAEISGYSRAENTPTQCWWPLLFLYLIPTTLIFHNFWAFTGIAMQTQLVNFLKNLSIMGGLLLAAAYDDAALVAERAAVGAIGSPAAPLRRAMTG